MISALPFYIIALSLKNEVPQYSPSTGPAIFHQSDNLSSTGIRILYIFIVKILFRSVFFLTLNVSLITNVVSTSLGSRVIGNRFYLAFDYFFFFF